jgi:hypothetical protein
MRQPNEVDILLEPDDGMIGGIEVKAIATVKSGNFAVADDAGAACKEKFAYGTTLCGSADVVPFGSRLAATPLSCRWRRSEFPRRARSSDFSKLDFA